MFFLFFFFCYELSSHREVRSTSQLIWHTAIKGYAAYYGETLSSWQWWPRDTISPLSALLLRLQLKRLSGHRPAKNNPHHLPTTQEKPFEVVGVFPLSFLPSRSLKTLHSELGGEELQRRQARGIERRGGTGGGWRMKGGENKSCEGGGREQEGYCCSTPLCHFSHLTSSLPVVSFQRDARGLSAVRIKHIKLVKTYGNALPGHVCDPTHYNYCEPIYL